MLLTESEDEKMMKRYLLNIYCMPDIENRQLVKISSHSQPSEESSGSLTLMVIKRES